MDLREVPIPVARYITRRSGAAGGVHVRLSPFDNRVVDIRFFDKNGQDLSKDDERNIERVFFREDFRRVYLDEIGSIGYAEQVRERYTSEFLANLNVGAIQRRNPYCVVDFANAPTADVLSPILAQLNVRVVALNAAVEESKMSIRAEEFRHSLEQAGPDLRGVADGHGRAAGRRW